MPKPASTAGGLDPSHPLPRCVQHQCFFEGDHASAATDFDVASLSILSITNDQNHTMGVADAMDTMDTMKHEFLIRCTEEVAQGSLAVKWVFASSMNFTASFLRQVGQTAVSSETLLDTHQFERTSIQVILSAWVHG